MSVPTASTVNWARMDLGWSKPPLNMNQRMHWAQKAKLTAMVRNTAHYACKHHRVPKDQAHVDVQLHYRPGDNRRRDADNLVPVLKACCDGLVDHSLVADDTPDLMRKHMPILHPSEGRRFAAMWLEIEWSPA